jgi:putative membrane protein
LTIALALQAAFADSAGRWGIGGAPHSGWWLGPVLSLLFLTLIGLIVWLIIRLRRPAARDSTHQARQVLADRCAKGELSTDEYTERLENL